MKKYEDDDILPEEDELMDRCMEFMALMTHPALKIERDAIFQSIMMASRLRAEDELKAYKYTEYPLICDVVPLERLRNQSMMYTGEQELFVNMVLRALKNKNAVSMGGGKFT